MALDASELKFLKKLGLHLRGLRDKKGWTLEETEERGGPSWTHLARIEAGKKNINVTTALRLSKIYKVSIEEIFKGL